MPISRSMGLPALPIRVLLEDICRVLVLLVFAVCPELQAKPIRPACPILAHSSISVSSIAEPARQLLVIGFMGGDVKPGNLVHREALMAKDLQRRYPIAVHAAVFANHDGAEALRTVLQFLDRDGNGCLSVQEKDSARIVIYGHSWGASETVALARRLNRLGIPVLLTIQVDSVQKTNENDRRIPPNVREAINFYQDDGLLHGRSEIEAMNPEKTDILGNFESTYRKNPVSCAGYPWYARAFMRSHIEIENDPVVWNRIEALIGTEVGSGG